MPHDKERAEDHREDAAKDDATEESAAKRIEADVRANRGVGLAIGPDDEKSRPGQAMERAANNNDR